MDLRRLSDRIEKTESGEEVTIKRWGMWPSNHDEIWKRSDQRGYMLMHDDKENRRLKSLEEAESYLRAVVEGRMK